MFFYYIDLNFRYFYRSMLNCVNALEQRIPCPPPPTERASLMISEEKPIPDPCECIMNIQWCKFRKDEQKKSHINSYPLTHVWYLHRMKKGEENYSPLFRWKIAWYQLVRHGHGIQNFLLIQISFIQHQDFWKNDRCWTNTIDFRQIIKLRIRQL